MEKKTKDKANYTVHLKEDFLRKIGSAQSDSEIDDRVTKFFCIPFNKFKFKQFERMLKDVIEIQYKGYFELKIKDGLRTKEELISLSPEGDRKKINSIFLTNVEIKQKGEAVKKMLLKNYYDHFGGEEKLFRIIHAAAFMESKSSLMKLIQYDKSWLYVEWVKYLIFRNQAKDDRSFFESLSDAMQLKRKDRLKFKSLAHERVLDFIDLYCNRKLYWPIKFTTLKLDALYDLIFEIIVEKNHFKLSDKELEGIKILDDKGYFKQYMKRKIQNDPVGLI